MKLPADKVAALRSAYQGREVCVTGGAGFIGGHLVDALHALGARVRVLDDLSNSTLEHLSGLIELDPDHVRFVHGSILDDEAVSEAIASRAIVFHLAAMGSVPRSIEQPQRTWSVNATGTLRVLEAARAADATRVVIASSSSVYGDQPELPKVETMPLRPLSPYAASKAAVEHLAGSWSQSYGLSTACLRYFNVFGPRQAADNAYAAVVAAFAKRLLAGEAPVIYGDGSATRDFTYVSNAVLATLLAGCAKGPLTGQAMNVGTGTRISIGDLAVEMAKLVGSPQVTPKYSERRAGDVSHSLADIARARQLIGYEPIASVQQGLADTLEWYKRMYQGT
jgi:nucleoside-diphosphate-sugar epimerase